MRDKVLKGTLGPRTSGTQPHIEARLCTLRRDLGNLIRVSSSLLSQPGSLPTDNLLGRARKINLESLEIYKLVGTECFDSRNNWAVPHHICFLRMTNLDSLAS